MTTDGKRSGVELPFDASGVGARGQDFALGTTRPRAQGGQAEVVPLAHGQIGEADKWPSESAVMAEKVFNFAGRKGPEMSLKW